MRTPALPCRARTQRPADAGTAGNGVHGNGDTAVILLSIGGLMLAGLATDALGRRTPLPRVTLLLLFGMLLGGGGLDLIPAGVAEAFPLVADMALLMIGFLLGERLTATGLAGHGRRILLLVLGESLGAAVAVFLLLLACGLDTAVALVLAAIAAASAPTATYDVVQEARAQGPFTNTLLQIVALDDVVGLVLFSVALAVALAVGGDTSAANPLQLVARDLGGAVLIGAVLGVPGAYLSGRIDAGQPSLVEALALVMLCGGLARWFDVSFLIAAVSMGAVVANLARHHERPFHAIENIEWPFMILFFSLAGMSVDWPDASGALLLVAAYVLARAAGRVGGCRLGAIAAGSSPAIRRYMGFALLPQAGVAIGMALMAASRLPETGALVLVIVVTTTVIFELVGPVFTRIALARAGESGAAGNEPP